MREEKRLLEAASRPLVLFAPPGARVYEPGSVAPGKVVELRTATYVVTDRSGTIYRADAGAGRLSKAQKKAAKRIRRTGGHAVVPSRKERKEEHRRRREQVTCQEGGETDGMFVRSVVRAQQAIFRKVSAAPPLESVTFEVPPAP